MSHRSCSTCNILLATFGFWTTLCSSYGLSLGNVTTAPTGSYGNTQQLSRAAQPSLNQKLGETIPTTTNTSHISTISSTLPSSQSGCSYILAYATFWPGPYVITRTDSTICPSLATSAMLPRIDATSTFPHGYGVYENTTFATSCAYNDPACYARCTNMATACGSKWFQWTSKNSYLTFTESPTSFSTTTVTSQSYSYSTSVVHEGEVRITFEYASPIGKPITTTSVRTLYSMDRIVTRWTDAPPTCTPSAWLKCTKGPDCRACTVQGGTVEVLFWPPASKVAKNETHDSLTRNFNNGSIALHSSILQPVVTAMFGTHTLTSPSVYISFQTAYALNDCGQTVGKAMPGALLPIDPQSLFTMRAGLDYFEVTSGSTQSTFYESASFNYNDFDGPVRPSAYTHQPSCLASGCYTIYPDYHPQLALPPQVRSMDPAWESCALDWRGAWDPPIALSQADSIGTPTNPAEVTLTEPASPKSTVGNPATMTSAPGELNDPPRASSKVVSSSATSPTTSGGPDPMFTYLPISPSDETRHGSTLIASQHPDKVNPAPPVIQITTIMQIDPQPVSSEIVVSKSASALDSSPELSTGNSEGDGRSTQQDIHGPSDPAPHASTSILTRPDKSENPRSIVGTMEQLASKADGGGLTIADTTITAGGTAITSEGVVYSAVLEDGLLIIISNIPPASNTHSPTNAYEVLSEALGSAQGHQTNSFGTDWSGIISPPTNPSTSQAISRSATSSSHTPLPEAILDLGSTTITAFQHPNSILQIGTQLFSGDESSAITIGDHTLSAAASNALIHNGTTATFAQQPSNTSPPTSLRSLPSVQAGGGSVLLPSVVDGGSAIEIESGGGGAASSTSEEGDGGGDASSASRLREVSGLLVWVGLAVIVLVGAW